MSVAAAPEELFKQGNAAYAEGKFAEAIPPYVEARDAGLRHWALFYNLGNAYYKTGQLGRAIAAYHRAFRLNAGQRDVIYNLTLASAKAGDPFRPTSALPALVWRLFYSVPLNLLTLASSLFFFTLSAGFVLLMLRRWPAAWPRAEAFAAAGFLFVLFAGWTAVRQSARHKAIGIVVTPVAEVRSGPNLTYPANFTVPEGRRVLLLPQPEPIKDWLEIGVPQEGLKGWVPAASVEVL